MEIERKFIVINDFPRTSPSKITQAYILTSPTVRVRIRDKKAYFTVKGKTKGVSRTEHEWEIPYWLGKVLIAPIRTKIEKTRYLVEVSGKTWEVDEFHGANEGLLVAELELESEDEKFVKPQFIGKEVSYEPRYSNSNLVSNPYKKWFK